MNTLLIIVVLTNTKAKTKIKIKLTIGMQIEQKEDTKSSASCPFSSTALPVMKRVSPECKGNVSFIVMIICRY